MGQNSSSAFQNSSQPLFSRRRPSRTLPPTITPENYSEPKTPNYVVAENKVLRNGAQSISKARKMLRPVSQELTKMHPDFADIFHDAQNASPQEDEDSNLRNANKENFTRAINSPVGSTDTANLAVRRDIRGRKDSSPNNIASTSSYQITDMPDKYMPDKNSHIPNQSRFTEANHSGTSPKENTFNMKLTTNLMRSRSVDKGLPQETKHKRQSSLGGGQSLQENVIHEDPREHLYNAGRSVPFSNFQPSTSSLPVKSTFNMDYSLNLTYAQLAEYRRNNRVAELEERTGKKLEELEAEIRASSNLPKSPFNHQNLGNKSSAHSVSTRSSETGVSKSKKKKAPAPPPPPKGPVLKKYSEPPIDYDLNNSSVANPHREKNIIHQRASSASKSMKPPAPQPLPKSQSSASLQASLSTNINQEQTILSGLSATLPRQSSEKSHDIYSLPHKNIFIDKSSLKQSILDAKVQLEALRKLEDVLRSNVSANEDALDNVKESPPDHTAVNDENVTNTPILDNNASLFQTAEKVSTIKISNQQKSRDEIGPQEYSAQHIVREDSHTLENQDPTNITIESNITIGCHELSEGDLTNPVSESAREKTSLSSTFEESTKSSETFKIKHHGVLKEEPIKAQYENDNNSQVLNDEKTIVFHSEFLKVTKKAKTDDESPEWNPISSESNKKSLKSDRRDFHLANETKSGVVKNSGNEEAPSSSVNATEENVIQSVCDPKDGAISSESTMAKEAGPHLFMAVNKEIISTSASSDISKRSSIISEDMSIESSNTSQRMFSSDWAPEHDLDSDDDIMVENMSTSEHYASSEGFKSSIVPPKISHMKESRRFENSRRDKQVNKNGLGITPANEKGKFDSIKRFKKSVHKGVKSAFGSISKASGKLLYKQRSQDLFDATEGKYRVSSSDYNGTPSELSRNHTQTFNTAQSRALQRAVSDGFIGQEFVRGCEDPELPASLDETGLATRALEIKTQRKNASQTTNRGHNPKVLKRAGALYVSGEGSIIVLPEYKADSVEEDIDDIVDEGQRSEGSLEKTRKKRKNLKRLSMKSEEKYKVQESVGSEKNEEASVSEDVGSYKLEETLVKEIADREKQIEAERQKTYEMERKLKRLSDLEIQERIQRLENDNIRQQISQLQQQQLLQQQQQQQQFVLRANEELNGNIVSTPSINNISAVDAPYFNSSSLQTPYLINNSNNNINNNNNQLFGTNYLNSFAYPGSTSPHWPSFSTTLLGQPNSHAAMTSILPDSLSLSTFSDGSTQRNQVGQLINLTPQELIYLSDYMRMLGVAPPANQQQWALLLSTVSRSGLDIPGHSQTRGNDVSPTLQNGPDLSQILHREKISDYSAPHTTIQTADVERISDHSAPNTKIPTAGMEKLSDHLAPNTAIQTANNEKISDHSAPNLKIQTADIKTISDHSTLNTTIQGADITLNQNSVRSMDASSLKKPQDDGLPISTTTQEIIPQKPHNNMETNSSESKGNDREVVAKENSETNTQELQNLSSIKLQKVEVNEKSLNNYDSTQSMILDRPITTAHQFGIIQPVNSHAFSGDKISSNLQSRMSYLPAKVYGPIGFRPVSFHATSSR